MLLEEAGLVREAAAKYVAVLDRWGEQPQISEKASEMGTAKEKRLREPEPATPPPARPAGRTFTLAVGISKYEQQGIANLNFADVDAKEFARYACSPRGEVKCEDSSGTELTVLDSKGEWVQVSDSAKRIGWLRREQVLFLPSSTAVGSS